MGELISYPNYTFVKTVNRKDIDKIKKALSFRPDGFQFTPKYKQGLWDGYIKLYNSRANAFPTGLLDLVTPIVPSYEINVVKPTITKYKFNAKKIPLYPYQEDVFRLFLDKKTNRGIFSLSVNWGKSYLISKLISYLNVRTLVVVHRTTLVFQLVETLSNFFNKKDIGVCAQGKIDIKPITVATIQTLEKLENIKDYYNYYNMIMIDEAHRASGKLYYKTMMNFDAYYRFGFTGTAEKKSKLENMQVKALTGDIIAKATISDTIDLDKSAKPLIYMVKYKDKYYPLHYQDAYVYHIVQNEKRNNIIKEIVNDLNLHTLIMVNFIEHGDTLSKLLNASFISGKDDAQKVYKILQKFNEGKLKTLIISTIGDEGLNIARADAVILAGAGKSEVRIIQRIGRSIRKYKGKKVVKIFDFLDEQDDTLNSHSLSRLKIYKSEKLETKIIDVTQPHLSIKDLL